MSVSFIKREPIPIRSYGTTIKKLVQRKELYSSYFYTFLRRPSRNPFPRIIIRNLDKDLYSSFCTFRRRPSSNLLTNLQKHLSLVPTEVLHLSFRWTLKLSTKERVKKKSSNTGRTHPSVSPLSHPISPNVSQCDLYTQSPHNVTRAPNLNVIRVPKLYILTIHPISSQSV